MCPSQWSKRSQHSQVPAAVCGERKAGKQDSARERLPLQGAEGWAEWAADSSQVLRCSWCLRTGPGAGLRASVPEWDRRPGWFLRHSTSSSEHENGLLLGSRVWVSPSVGRRQCLLTARDSSPMTSKCHLCDQRASQLQPQGRYPHLPPPFSGTGEQSPAKWEESRGANPPSAGLRTLVPGSEP